MGTSLDFTDDGNGIRVPLQLAKGPQQTIVKVYTALRQERGRWLDDDRFGVAWDTLGLESALSLDYEIRQTLKHITGATIQRIDITRARSTMIELYIQVASDSGPVDYLIGLPFDPEIPWYYTVLGI